MTVRRVLLSALVAALLLVRPAVAAQAHTQAVASWPSVGQVVTETPDRVTVAFSGEVLPGARVDVVGPDGDSLADGDPVVLGRVVTQALVPLEGAGVVTASVRVVGADGHPVSGSIQFAVDPEGVATANPAGPEPDLGLDDEPAGSADEAVTSPSENPAEDPDDTGGLLLMAGLVAAALVAALALRTRWLRKAR